MKYKLLFLIAFMPAVLIAQHYEITLTELKTAGAVNKKNTNKIDITQPDWQKEAKLIFTQLGEDDFAKIVVRTQPGGDTVIAEPDAGNGKAVFNLEKVLDTKTFSFEVFYNDTLNGLVIFNVTGEKITSTVTDLNQTADDSVFQSYMGALAGANFVGNNKFLSNLTPIVNLGGVVPLFNNNKGFSWQLDVNPYVGADIDTKDSASFIPALMLYGKGGLILNNYLNFDLGKTRIILMPLGFGLKFIPNLQDSGNTVIQHNLRTGIALKYDNAFVLSAQLTHGWHHLTSESGKSFKKTFGNTATKIDYLTVTGQFAVRGKADGITNYIYLEWRGLLSKKEYAGFTNNAILTLGFRKTLELSGGGIFAAGTNSQTRKNKRVHLNL